MLAQLRLIAIENLRFESLTWTPSDTKEVPKQASSQHEVEC